MNKVQTGLTTLLLASVVTGADAATITTTTITSENNMTSILDGYVDYSSVYESNYSRDFGFSQTTYGWMGSQTFFEPSTVTRSEVARSQGPNFATEASTVYVAQTSEEGTLSCRASGALKVSHEFIDADPSVTTAADVVAAFANADTARVEGRFNVPLFEYNRFEDQSSDINLWMGYGVDMDQVEAFVVMGDQQIQAQINPENGYKLTFANEADREAVAAWIMEGNALDVYARSSNSQEPKFGHFVFQGNEDVTGAMTDCMDTLNEYDREASREINVQLSALETEVPAETIEQIFGNQCLAREFEGVTAADGEVLEVDSATGAKFLMPHAFRFVDDATGNVITAMGDQYALIQDADGNVVEERISKSWLNDRATSCAGDTTIDRTPASMSTVTAGLFGQTTNMWDRIESNVRTATTLTGLFTGLTTTTGITTTTTTVTTTPDTSPVPIPAGIVLLGSVVAAGAGYGALRRKPS